MVDNQMLLRTSDRYREILEKQGKIWTTFEVYPTGKVIITSNTDPKRREINYNTEEEALIATYKMRITCLKNARKMRME